MLLQPGGIKTACCPNDHQMGARRLVMPATSQFNLGTLAHNLQDRLTIASTMHIAPFGRTLKPPLSIRDLLVAPWIDTDLV